WLEDSWLDIAVLVVVAALAGGLNTAKVASNRNFPIHFSPSSTELIFPELAYPRRSSTVPIWLDALLAILVPTVFFIIAQLRIRSFYDLNTAFWGNLWGVATTSLFQVMIKTLIGGLRPHFLSVCNPSPQAIRAGSGQGFGGIMFDASVCNPTNPSHFKDSMKSFPSGHTTTAAAGFVFLSLYFNAKMKIFADQRPHYYKIWFFFAPLLAVMLVGGAAILDNSHHWYDVVVGGIIGTLGAFAAFRMSYASIWDYRFNHIPLPRPSSSWTPAFPTGSPEPMNGKTQTMNGHPVQSTRFYYVLGPSSDFPSWANGWSRADAKLGPGMEGWREPNWHMKGGPGDAAPQTGFIGPAPTNMLGLGFGPGPGPRSTVDDTGRPTLTRAGTATTGLGMAI
ncbi:hypothetical protein FRC02_006109, partial [Tulasnella sp. 418]